MRVGEVVKTSSGWLQKVNPLHKWRRPDGPASFLEDMMQLRKALSLCWSCEHKMPRKWLDKYGYSLVRNFHTEASGCDLCRNVTSTNLYVATEGTYNQEAERMERYVRETRARDKAIAERDPYSRLYIG
jgi:hypothetical protein